MYGGGYGMGGRPMGGPHGYGVDVNRDGIPDYRVKPGVPGDVNGDGYVNGADVDAVAKHIMGQTPDVFYEEAANVNGDGKIDAADIVLIVNMITN